MAGNKSDMESRRVIPKERGEQLAEEFNIPFLEISAKSNTNVNEAFETLVGLVLSRHSKNVRTFYTDTLYMDLAWLCSFDYFPVCFLILILLLIPMN